MTRKTTIVLLLAALLTLPGILFAQSKPATAKPAGVTVTITDWENTSGNAALLDDKGATQPEPSIGDKFPLGWTITTGKGDTAELQLDPTKTVVKIAQLTNFTVKSLRSDTAGTDTFALTLGKVRTVVGRASGKDQYKIQTPSAVCGVRGSDVVIDTGDGTQDKLFTLEGTGYMEKPDGTALDIPMGQFADALASVFQTVAIPADILSSLKSEMTFSPKTDVAAANAAHQEDLQQSGGAGGSQQPGQSSGGTPSTPPPPKTNGFLDSIMKKLEDILGMQIGSITIGGQTYSEAVISPTFALGKLKMALYLPIIYQGDMFNPSDYYHPAGNDEWDFGGLLTGHPLADPWALTADLLNDLLLKIKYIEWGAQRDPFFFKLGNLDDITIGHGLIMNNFSNDADFPAVRRVGLNIGADLGGFGFEAMVNDAAAPDVFGGRLYIRPIKGFKAALGLSTVVDIGAGQDFNGGPDAAGNPIFVNPGIDLDLPFVESDFFGLVAFADGAAMLPFFRTAPTAATGIPAGFALNAIYDASAQIPVKNWGVAAGLFGNLIIPGFTWRAEFRDFNGTFQPGFYSAGYERQRNALLQNLLAYLQNPTDPSFNQQTLGIYGEGGLTLPKLFSLNLNYFWPWTQDPVTGQINTSADDQLSVTFTLDKGVIPVVNIYGSVSYTRTKFVSTIMNGGEQGLTLGQALFDANTVVSASISYPVSDVLDVTLLYTTTAHRNAAGVLTYVNNPPLPDMDTSLSIETQIHL